MKIYVAHSKQINYIDELYKPLRNDMFFNNHKLILPHENNQENTNTRDFYKSIDVLIAECSKPATGLGIELAWAYDDNKPIYCFVKKKEKISNSIKAITNNIFEYTDELDLINQIKERIKYESNNNSTTK